MRLWAPILVFIHQDCPTARVKSKTESSKVELKGIGDTIRAWSMCHSHSGGWKICASRGSANTQTALKHVPREPPSGSDPEPTMKKTEENNTLCSFWMSSPTSTSSMGLWRYSVILLWLRPALWSDLIEKMFYLRLALDYDTLYLSNKIGTFTWNVADWFQTPPPLTLKITLFIRYYEN